MNEYVFDELEKHPAHLMLNQVEAGIYIELLEKDINKWIGVLKKVMSYSYESNVKRDLKANEITKRIQILGDLLEEMKEQTAW
jgi:hypothetical protein